MDLSRVEKDGKDGEIDGGLAEQNQWRQGIYRKVNRKILSVHYLSLRTDI